MPAHAAAPDSDETAQADNSSGEAVVKNTKNSTDDQHADDYDNAVRADRIPGCPRNLFAFGLDGLEPCAESLTKGGLIFLRLIFLSGLFRFGLFEFGLVFLFSHVE